jgi:hypothetical protein
MALFQGLSWIHRRFLFGIEAQVYGDRGLGYDMVVLCQV